MSTDAVRYPKEGRLSAMRSWLAGELGPAVIRLYVNNHIYNENDGPGNYVEAAFVGYAPIVGPAWGAPFINGANKAEIDSPALTFTFTGGSGVIDVYGMYCTDPGLTDLKFVVPFQNLVKLTPGSPSRTFVLQLTDTSEL